MERLYIGFAWPGLDGRLSPCSSAMTVGIRRSTAAHGGSPRWSRWIPERRLWPCGRPRLEEAPGRTCRPRDGGAQARPGFLVGLGTLWGTHGVSRLSLKDCTLWKSEPHCSSPWTTVAHGMDSRWGSSWRIISRGRDPTLKKEEDPSPWAAAGTITITPTQPLSHWATAGEEVVLGGRWG